MGDLSGRYTGFTERLVDSVLAGTGHTPNELRRAIEARAARLGGRRSRSTPGGRGAGEGVPDLLAGYVDKVAGLSHPESRRLRIDLDPVGAHLRPQPMPEIDGDDRRRCQQRHVTIDAAADQLVSVLRKESTVLNCVARETPPRERDGVSLLAVDIVAGGGGHLCRPGTPAPVPQGPPGA